MTREQTKELLPILEAYANGEQIEYKAKQFSEHHYQPHSHLIFYPDPARFDYRIAPKLKTIHVGLFSDHYNNPCFRFYLDKYLSDFESRKNFIRRLATFQVPNDAYNSD